MTVNELITRLEIIKQFVDGTNEVQAWDPDTEQWEPITCLTYGKDEPVRLYTDVQ